MTGSHSRQLDGQQPADQVRLLQRDDARESGRIQASELPHGFFASLGPRFLATYHRTFIESPYAVAFATGEGSVEAFLVGTTNNPLHYRWVFRHRLLRLGIAGALALAVRPRILFRFIRTRIARYLRGFKRTVTQTAPAVASGRQEQVAVLTHVAVAPDGRGRGRGKALVEAFVAAARSAEADRALLVTIAAEGGAGEFYQRIGWSQIGTKTDRDGTRMASYELILR